MRNKRFYKKNCCWVSPFKGIPIQLCVSNDFGMALASTLCALTAGARIACTSVNGIGPRNGVAATEEVISCLTTLLGCSKYQLDRLMDLSIFTELITGTDIAFTKHFGGLRNYIVPEAQLQSATHHSLYWFGTAPELFGRKVQAMHTRAEGIRSVKHR
ncbi:MAG: hypothetical protein ACRDBO_17800 [Lachnospiraceae bacterium]